MYATGSVQNLCMNVCAQQCPWHIGSFDLLIYADSEASVPTAWEESDPKYITNSDEMRLRSFTTKVAVLHFRNAFCWCRKLFFLPHTGAQSQYYGELQGGWRLEGGPTLRAMQH
jgi:hypothetical protein